MLILACCSPPGGGFGTLASGHLDLKPCQQHRIHWHTACDQEVYSHHLFGDMIFIRIKTYRLLRKLANRKFALSTLTALDGHQASTGLIRIC